MSVQSKIDRIKSVVSEQEDLLQQMKTNLVGKAAGNGGGVELPTLQNQGNSEHLLEGKQLINQSGIRVIGRMPNKGAIDAMIDGLTAKSYTVPEGYHNGSGTVSLTDDIDNIALEQGDLIQQIKTALAEKAAGGGVELPDIAEEERGTASDLAEGKKLIGADGSVVTGSLPVSDSYFYGEYTHMYDEDGIISPNYFLDRDIILRKNTRIFVDVPSEDYGNAGPADVRSGKTFTSKDGFCVTGTLEAGGAALVAKTGTTTSTTIDTGLAEIVAIMLKATKQTVTGIFTASYMAYQDILQFTSASVISNSKILTTTTIQSAKSSSNISINGGALTWKSTGSLGFCSGVSYEWYALGYE